MTPGVACRQVAACASSRYEFEVFSGSVVSVTSEALVSSQSPLLAFARAANLWRKPPLAALHQMVVRTPDGRARTFSFGTETADIPAQVPPARTLKSDPPHARALSPGRTDRLVLTRSVTKHVRL